MFGALNLKTRSFFWKSSQRGNAKTFIEFIHQLRANCKDRKIVLLLDNVSFHNCKKLKKFTDKFKDIILFSLPPYSPEYNPVEQIWKWIKRTISARKAPFNSIEELITQFRRLICRRRNNRADCDINIGIGIWKSLFV